MPFYTMNELLALDPAKDWCIGHFNVHNYTTLGGVVKAACHYDLIMTGATVVADGTTLLRDGVVLEENL